MAVVTGRVPGKCRASEIIATDEEDLATRVLELTGDTPCPGTDQHFCCIDGETCHPLIFTASYAGSI